MNKKKIIAYSFMGVFALVLVSAGLIQYYGSVEQEISIESPIVVSGETTFIGGYAGQPFEGNPITITNDADFSVDVEISNDAYLPKNKGIEVSYVGTLELTKKDITTWDLIGEPITIQYTVVGDSFEVTGVEEGYTAIYYKDEFVGLENREANPQPAISIIGVGNLPELDDVNAELEDYCESDNYNQCNGAKIWVVPTTDLTGLTLNWDNMDDYYYELDLIQYNSEGNIVMSGKSELVITPVYTIAPDYIGSTIITTEVLPVIA